jgi:hypothetical protein
VTPQQEARLLRARAQTLKAQADAAEGADRAYDVGLGGPRYRHPAYLEADACEAIAAELEAQAMLKPAERAWCASCGMTRVEHETPRTPGACRGFTSVTTP